MSDDTGIGIAGGACGFPDMTYLTRWFKARFDVTPGGVRKQPAG